MTEFKLDGAKLEADINSSGEFFADMADHAFELLTEHGLAADDARVIINALTLRLAETFHGEKFYIGKQPKVFATWIAALQDLRFMHSSDVDKKYGWSQGYSLKIAQKVKQQQEHRQQLRLPFSK